MDGTRGMARCVAAVVALVVCMGGATATVAAVDATDAPALWWGMSPGPHAVGFRSTWTLDVARDYDTPLSDGGRYAGEAPRAPRPILVLAWYPADVAAEAPRLAHGDYFAIDDVPADVVARAPRLPLLARDLSAYARDVLVQQLFEAPEDSLDASDAARLAELLATPTAAVRDAPSAAGRFPVVLHHSGYGSSFEDDATLCELLASEGHVVLASAFLRADGSSFSIDGSDGSQADLDALVRFAAATLPCADTTRLAMVGHSGGAHVTLERAARPHTALDACVVLDTTQDGNSLLDPRWKPTVDACLGHVDEVDEPLLVATRPFGFFQLLDRMTRADRDYLTFRDLDHDDFIAQGGLVADMAARRAREGATGDASDDRGRPAAEHAEAIHARYRDLCAAIVAFLDATLRDEPAAWDDLRARWTSTPLGGEPPHLERAPPGVDGPAPYDVPSIVDGPPPTPRQFRRILAEHGGEVALDVLRVVRARDRDGPFTDIVHDTALLYELTASGRDDDARAFGAYLESDGSQAVSMLVTFARVYDGERYHDFRRTCVRAALLAAPDDTAAQQAWTGFEDDDG